MKKTIIIIGAGPAGLTSALLLIKANYRVIVYESDPLYVGGLSRTVKQNGFRFDIGGHRFFTKEKSVRDFWEKILGDDLRKTKRISRILYKKKFLSYPLEMTNLLLKLNPIETLSMAFSFLKAKIFKSPKSVEPNFENWIISQFGKKLYDAFFKSYTEKVWGIDCTKISSDWAKQRINGLSISALIKKSIFQILKIKDSSVKSLIEEFDYPIHGPGMLWEKVSKEFIAHGGQLIMGVKVQNIKYENNKWIAILPDNQSSEPADDLISSAPLGELLQGIIPSPPQPILQAASHFHYRGFITVALFFKGTNDFPDNWLYVHDTRVKVGRIQNYKNWSTDMTPGPDYVCYGLEYFCQENDSFWQLTEDELFELAKKELQILGIKYTLDELSFSIIRCPFAYPVYDLNYKARLKEVRIFLSEYSNLHLVGRCGLHRYNNQDHSIKTAMLTVENIKLGFKQFDPWLVNQDAEYIETQNT
jgi:protoporphyrinogen oxidase